MDVIARLDEVIELQEKLNPLLGSGIISAERNQVHCTAEHFLELHKQLKGYTIRKDTPKYNNAPEYIARLSTVYGNYQLFCICTHDELELFKDFKMGGEINESRTIRTL